MYFAKEKSRVTNLPGAFAAIQFNTFVIVLTIFVTVFVTDAFIKPAVVMISCFTCIVYYCQLSYNKSMFPVSKKSSQFLLTQMNSMSSKTQTKML